MVQQFYGHGKLLITGEYAVLDGALAWAMPTKFGQHLRVSENDSGKITWKSLDENGFVWYEAIFGKDLSQDDTSSDPKISATLQQLLLEAKRLNPEFLNTPKGYAIETELTFPRDWGLGSSSTLISTIAQWAKVDPFKLLWNAFQGSGYDIACATEDGPITYQLKNGSPVVTALAETHTFLDSVHFVHLNKKRNSREAIDAYRQRKIDKAVLIKTVSQLTRELISTTDMEQFEKLIQAHEVLLSDALGIPTLQQALFPRYHGTLKSLGAWGGDFMLVTRLDEQPDYFRERGYPIAIPFQEMIL